VKKRDNTKVLSEDEDTKLQQESTTGIKEPSLVV
jgi:hypothetical protein